jgi:hypothetical protein
MEIPPVEVDDHERKRKRKHKRTNKHPENDDSTLPQLVNLSDEHRECLIALQKRADQLLGDYDADLRTWSSGMPPWCPFFVQFVR